MQTIYLIGVVAAALCISPPKPELIPIAQFNLYIDPTSYKDGHYKISWDSKIEPEVYADNCQALYDLLSFQPEICDSLELQQLYKLLEQLPTKKL